MWSPVRCDSAIEQEFIWVEASFPFIACAPHHMLENTQFQQCFADACVFSLVEEGRVAIIAVLHADDIFAVEL